jgi:hypothetical protein
MSAATLHVWNGARLSAVLALLTLSACAASVPGEVTAAACSTPTIDEDHDDLIDCADPDCHGFEHCRRLRDDGPNPPSTGGSGGMSSSGGSGGSGGGEPLSGGTGGSDPDDDAGGIQPIDAGDNMSAADAAEPEPPPPCGGSCGVGFECDIPSNVCMPTGTQGGRYTITVLSATAPRETPIAQCVDPCQGVAVWCPCLADPFVRVVRVRPAQEPSDPAEEDEIVKTATLRDNEAPTFMEAPAPLELDPGDVLRFELWQDLLLSDDARVYDCTPDLADVAPGELACTAMSGGAGSEMFEIRVRLDAAP